MMQNNEELINLFINLSNISLQQIYNDESPLLDENMIRTVLCYIQ